MIARKPQRVGLVHFSIHPNRKPDAIDGSSISIGLDVHVGLAKPPSQTKTIGNAGFYGITSRFFQVNIQWLLDINDLVANGKHLDVGKVKTQIAKSEGITRSIGKNRLVVYHSRAAILVGKADPHARIFATTIAGFIGSQIKITG